MNDKPYFRASKKANTSGHRLRVGYFSSDLRTHAVGFLTAGLFETHDRHQFEIFAFSSGKADEKDLYCQRISSGCEHFVDASCMSDAELVVLGLITMFRCCC